MAPVRRWGSGVRQANTAASRPVGVVSDHWPRCYSLLPYSPGPLNRAPPGALSVRLSFPDLAPEHPPQNTSDPVSRALAYFFFLFPQILLRDRRATGGLLPFVVGIALFLSTVISIVRTFIHLQTSYPPNHLHYQGRSESACGALPLAWYSISHVLVRLSGRLPALSRVSYPGAPALYREEERSTTYTQTF